MYVFSSFNSLATKVRLFFYRAGAFVFTHLDYDLICTQKLVVLRILPNIFPSLVVIYASVTINDLPF